VVMGTDGRQQGPLRYTGTTGIVGVDVGAVTLSGDSVGLLGLHVQSFHQSTFLGI
jgi:hypothetical protein